jgi:hypothetical protein
MLCATCGVAKLSSEYADLPPGAATPEARRHCKRSCLSCLLQNPDELPATLDLETLQRVREQTSKIAEFAAISTAAAEARANAQNILVRDKTGRSVEDELPESGSVRDLKKNISKKMDLPVRGMRLILAGKEIKGRQQTLSDLGVTRQSQLLLVMAFSQYAGQNAISGAARDQYGNAAGSTYDLTVDGAFEGMTVAVLHLYTGENFTFHETEQALQQKGFQVHRWMGPPVGNNIPTPEELKAFLARDDVTQV